VIILEKQTIYNIAKHTLGASSPHCEKCPQVAGNWLVFYIIETQAKWAFCLIIC
jgi:hypothetical protein